MQDLKNNDGQRHRSDAGQNGHEPHPFDRQWQRRLTEAEVGPPAGLMDQVFAALEAEQSKNGPKGRPAPVKPVRPAWFRLPRIAAIAGILVVVAIGIRQLTGPGPVVSPPEALTTVQPPAVPEATARSPKAPQRQSKEHKSGKAIAAEAAPETQTEKGIAAEKKRPEASAVSTPDKRRPALLASGHGQAGTGQKDKRGAVAKLPAGTQDNRTAGNDAGQQAGQQAGQKPGRAEQKAGSLAITKTTVKQAALDPAPLLPVPSKDKRAALAVPGQPADRENRVALSRSPQNAIATETLTGKSMQEEDKGTALARGTDLNNKEDRGRPGRSGLLKGLLKKIGNAAREITGEVVSQDEDKTVINVGVLAITAYK